MSTRSIKVIVSLSSGEAVEGWDYGETPLGYYVALDRAGTNIRFVPKGTYQSIGWHHEAERAIFPDDVGIDEEDRDEQIQKFQQRLRRPLELIDYNQVRRIASRLRELDSYYGSHFDHARLHDITATYDAHIALFDQLENSGLEEVLDSGAELLRSQVSRHTLPAAEADVVYLDKIDSMIATAKEATERQPRSELISVVTPAAIERYIYHFEMRKLAQPKEEGKTVSDNTWSRTLKIAVATGKFALGGLFASANLGLGAFAGVVPALPTLTMGTVDTAVCVATSIFTGLETSLDALKDMAEVIENP